ncbi:hypothetical protein GWI33_021086 [Rhynchophorus ferrugineus]|uniref:Uncharacterized protein n=1 Tax=Rhynchophorus ferrugineus TaxID=354439 RepID=A0A834I213_RHYFE|nr:hypothetical protein GWI33_021086 [Rhynchophorus ferrugineus]
MEETISRYQLKCFHRSYSLYSRLYIVICNLNRRKQFYLTDDCNLESTRYELYQIRVAKELLVIYNTHLELLEYKRKYIDSTVLRYSAAFVYMSGFSFIFLMVNITKTFYLVSN